MKYAIRRGVLGAVATAAMLVSMSAHANNPGTFDTTRVWTSGQVDASDLPNSGCFVSSTWAAYPWGSAITVCDNTGDGCPNGWRSDGMVYSGAAIVECNDNNAIYTASISTSTQSVIALCPFGYAGKIWAGIMYAIDDPNVGCAF